MVGKDRCIPFEMVKFGHGIMISTRCCGKDQSELSASRETSTFVSHGHFLLSPPLPSPVSALLLRSQSFLRVITLQGIDQHLYADEGPFYSVGQSSAISTVGASGSSLAGGDDVGAVQQQGFTSIGQWAPGVTGFNQWRAAGSVIPSENVYW